MSATVRTRLSPEARKKQLLDTAREMIVRDGLQHFTMEALARSAGVTAPLVYNYFSSRQMLLQSLLVQEYDSFRLKIVA
jgi:AcrR family transcriptional regulator